MIKVYAKTPNVIDIKWKMSPVRFRALSHTGVMDYDEACGMHLTPGVVHNFPKAVGV